MARTYEGYRQVKSFSHEKINFICSNQRIIFFITKIGVFRKLKKKINKTKEKQRMTSAISSLVRIWKISHSYPGCSFIWKIRAVYFSVKHSYLCNKDR